MIYEPIKLKQDEKVSNTFSRVAIHYAMVRK